MRFIRLILASAMLLSAAPLKAEDAYPSRQVSVIVPFAAGGTADIFARMVANHLQAKLGKPFVVENVGGAGSIWRANCSSRRPAPRWCMCPTRARARC